MRFSPEAYTLLKEIDALNRKLLMLGDGKGRYYLFFSGVRNPTGGAKRFLGRAYNHPRLPFPTGKAL